MENFEFTDAPFLSAKEKQMIVRNWEGFIKSGFSRNSFTKKLYDHLHLHCSFIAHFNIDGFYNTYFRHPGNTIKFLQQFDDDYGHKSVELGGTWWAESKEYADITKAMIAIFAVKKKQVYAELKNKHIAEVESDIKSRQEHLEQLKSS